MYREHVKDQNAEQHLELSVRKLRNLECITHQLSMGGMMLDALSMMTESSCDLVCPVIVKVPEFTRKKIDKNA